MSHTVTVQTKIYDAAAVAAACRRLKLPTPSQGTARLYSSEATGLIVTLPGWEYPLVIDTGSGNMRYDNFEGHWGNPKQLNEFLQMYAVEKAKLEATKQGYRCHEQSLQDGSIKLQIFATT